METINTHELRDTISKPSIKLIKNTKGYSWEIKILELDPCKLEQLNQEMIEKFGGADI